MKIHNMQINAFGNIKNKQIELSNGINVIYGKNESGKSTLLKFIVDILYGISKNKRGKEFSDYEHYRPWNSEEFSGKISYMLDNGKRIEVFRDFNKKNPIIYDDELNDISKEFTIDKTNGNQFFTEQTGIDEATFLTTLGSMQQEVRLERQEQNILVQKLANLSSTGDDKVSYKRAIEKINKRQVEEIGTSRTQGRPINIIKEGKFKLQDEIGELEEYKKKKHNIENVKQELEEKLERYEAKLLRIKELKEQEEEREIEKQVEERVNKINRQKVNIIKIISMIVMAISMILAIVLRKNVISLISMIALFIISLVVLIINVCFKKKNNQIERIERTSKRDLAKELNEVQEKVNKTKLEIHSLELDKNNVIPKLERLAEMDEQLKELEQREANLLKQNESIELAKQVLEIAYKKMKENVTPKFTQELSKNIEKISNGKYKKVRINDEEGIIVERENGEYVSSEKLSVGTIDQLYLSLRFGAIKELSQESMPIILDESFAYYDEERLENVLKYIVEEFRNRQVIIFTCTNREKQVFDNNNIEYNYIEI